ncbi:MAG: hypothetical protein LBT01_07525 [Spirochaetaceae bacterium]|nr:hypothetical protein [Spirochaetaceae bacterium]
MKSTPVSAALSAFLNALGSSLSPRFERVESGESLGRILSQAVYARASSPMFNASAMDGIAVNAADTALAAADKPITLLRGKKYQSVNTGDPVRPPFNAVIMAEEVRETGMKENACDTVELRSPASPWQNIRTVGDDIVRGEMLLPSRHRIQPVDIGVLLAGNITEIDVFKKPRVAIIPTGTEIVKAGAASYKEGEIIESNGGMLRAMTWECGGGGTLYPPVADDYTLLRTAVKDALATHDMVLVNAASSAGTEDYTASVLAELGSVIVHGVAMKPGKPVILAIVDNKPVIGIPGYPVAAHLAFNIFAAPLLRTLSGCHAENAAIGTAAPLHRALAGCSEGNAPTIQAVFSGKRASPPKAREYIRVRVSKVDDTYHAVPVGHGSSSAMSLVKADGFCVVPENKGGLDAGELVPVELYRPLAKIEGALAAIGAEDIMLEIMSDIFLTMDVGGFSFSSAPAGSIGGLQALKRGECHIAPIHLLDENSGEYNVPFIRAHFKDEDMALIKGVRRTLGLIVQKGNPLNIKGVRDLASCRYIHRQRGSGTRVFCDYQLKQAGLPALPPDTREATGQLAVASAVSSDSADAGLGVLAAARALDLDFIPLGTEEYDFACRPRHLELPQTKLFLKILTSEAFTRRLEKSSGYTFDRCGDLVMISALP